MGNEERSVVARAAKVRTNATPESPAALAIRRDALLRDIIRRLGFRNHDELRVVDWVLGGLEKGEEEHPGGLNIAADERDWSREALEEERDLLAYMAMRDIARRDRALERLRCEAADEIAHAQPVEHGLAELRDSTPAIAPRPLLEFEMDDERDLDDDLRHDDDRDLGGEVE